VYSNDGSGAVRRLSSNSIQIGAEVSLPSSVYQRKYSIEAIFSTAKTLLRLNDESNFHGVTSEINALGCSNLQTNQLVKSIQVKCGFIAKFFSNNDCQDGKEVFRASDNRDVSKSYNWKSVSVEKIVLARSNTCDSQIYDDSVNIPGLYGNAIIGRTDGQGLDTMFELQQLEPMTKYTLSAFVYHKKST
jgi:hypothetical protein